MLDVRGKTVVLTGSFVAVKRAVAEAGLEARGAKVSGAVTKKSDIVFAGENAGGKLVRARELGVPVYDETALLGVLTGQEPSLARAASEAPHWFHAGFDRMVRELEAHPRVRVLCVARGAAGDSKAQVPLFAKHLGIGPGDDVRAFYAARDGCALLWCDADDPAYDPARHARDDAFPRLDRQEDLPMESLHVIAMPPVAELFGPRGFDYARGERAAPGDALERYHRSYWGFDFPRDYYTPAFCVERGRVMVQVGDDHGTFEDRRPTVAFDDYLCGVLGTRGSIPWRHRFFGFPSFDAPRPGANGDPRGWLAAHPLEIDDLFASTQENQRNIAAAAGARADALPAEPRLRSLVEAAEVARSISLEALPDGRQMLLLVRADGGRQLAYLTLDERARVEASLAARTR